MPSYKPDRSFADIPQRDQRDIHGRIPAHASQLPGPGRENEKPRSPGSAAKMPKARALALASTLKKWLVAASVVGFGTLSGMVALHQVGTTTAVSQSTTSSSSSSASQSATSTPTNISAEDDDDDDDGFLNQKGNNFGTNNATQTGGQTSGSSQPSSGSRVS